jgi:hypothetical protein
METVSARDGARPPSRTECCRSLVRREMCVQTWEGAPPSAVVCTAGRGCARRAQSRHQNAGPASVENAGGKSMCAPAPCLLDVSHVDSLRTRQPVRPEIACAWPLPGLQCSRLYCAVSTAPGNVVTAAAEADRLSRQSLTAWRKLRLTGGRCNLPLAPLPCPRSSHYNVALSPSAFVCLRSCHHHIAARIRGKS